MKRKPVAQATQADPLTAQQRRHCMSRIRATDTKPEMIVRRGLHAMGLRYRIHDRQLPGTPDLVFPSRRTLLFVNGCFWHGHHCPLFRLPTTRTEFWEAKIRRNRERDVAARTEAEEQGWRVLTIWECALRGRGRMPSDALLAAAFNWIEGPDLSAEIQGLWDGDR